MPGDGTRRAVPWQGLPLGVGPFPMTQGLAGCSCQPQPGFRSSYETTPGLEQRK